VDLVPEEVSLVDDAPGEDEVVEHVEHDRPIDPVVERGDGGVDGDGAVEDVRNRVYVPPWVDGHVENGSVGESSSYFLKGGGNATGDGVRVWAPNVVGSAVEDEHFGIQTFQLPVGNPPETVFDRVTTNAVIDGAQRSVLGVPKGGPYGAPHLDAGGAQEDDFDVGRILLSVSYKFVVTVHPPFVWSRDRIPGVLSNGKGQEGEKEE